MNKVSNSIFIPYLVGNLDFQDQKLAAGEIYSYFLETNSVRQIPKGSNYSRRI
jgi:hypothetical protein